MNGTAATATPTPPTTPLAVIRKRRRLFSLEFVRSVCHPHAFRTSVKMGASRAVRAAGSRQPPFARVRVAKPVNYTGLTRPAGSLGALPGAVKSAANQALAGGPAQHRAGRRASRCRDASAPAALILSPMLRKFWLLFAQACTLCLAALFVVATLRPDLLPRTIGRAGSVIVTQETATPVVARARGELRGRREESDAGGRQHLHEQGSALAQPARRRSAVPPLLSRTSIAARRSGRRASAPASSSPRKATCSPIIT